MAEWVASLVLWWYVIFYLGVQLVNVILNTFKTIITARGSMIPAAVINALTFGFYTIVVALTADISNLWVNMAITIFANFIVSNLWVNMAITIFANFIGVCFSIWLLNKLRKDKLWEIVATVSNDNDYKVANSLHDEVIPYTMVKDSTNHTIFHIYSANQKESIIIKKILQKYNAKYIVHQEEVRL